MNSGYTAIFWITFTMMVLLSIALVMSVSYGALNGEVCNSLVHDHMDAARHVISASIR
jgi:hypothetical protein